MGESVHHKQQDSNRQRSQAASGQGFRIRQSVLGSRLLFRFLDSFTSTHNHFSLALVPIIVASATRLRLLSSRSSGLSDFGRIHALLGLISVNRLGSSQKMHDSSYAQRIRLRICVYSQDGHRPAHTNGATHMKTDPTLASLCNAYRGLADLWHRRADNLLRAGDTHGVYMAVKEAIACESKARQIEQRHSTLETLSND